MEHLAAFLFEFHGNPVRLEFSETRPLLDQIKIAAAAPAGGELLGILAVRNDPIMQRATVRQGAFLRQLACSLLRDAHHFGKQRLGYRL